MAGKACRGNAADARLAEALAKGLPVAQAAREAAMPERTAWRRVADPAFRALVRAARSRLVREVGGRLVSCALPAVYALAKLLTDDDAKVRLGAARAILDGVGRFECIDLADELEAVKEQLEEVRRGNGGIAAVSGEGTGAAARRGGPDLGGDAGPAEGGPGPGAGGDGDAPGPVAEVRPLFG